MPYNESVNRIDLINFPELGAETTILDIESNSQYKFLNAGNQCLFLDMYGISDDYTVQKVYDNSSPLHPVEVSTDTVLGKIENFEFLGNFTVKTFEYNRVISIKVFDVSDPSSVDLVGFSPVFDRVNITSVIKDGFVYLYHSDDYIRSYDTSDPNNIEVAGRVHFSTFQSTPSLIQLGDYLGAILDSTIGFFDISDQYRPFYLAQIDHQDEIHEAMMNGNLVYIRSANQITIYEMEETSGVSMADGPLVSKTISLVQNYPNPFNGFTNVVIDLKKQSNSVQLLTYDILGRRVETRRLGVLSKGVNTISYSLNRPAGTYFIQIRMGNEVSAMKKIQLVK